MLKSKILKVCFDWITNYIRLEPFEIDIVCGDQLSRRDPN